MIDLGVEIPPVIDASPLIFLSKAQRLDILSLAYSRVLVPQPVALEIQQYGTTDITSQALKDSDWLEVVSVSVIPQLIRRYALDPGESAVLTWAYHTPGTEVILDDLAGRRCAQKLRLPVRGTLGLVLAAKKRGQIVAELQVMIELKESGMYLSDQVMNQALALVRE